MTARRLLIAATAAGALLSGAAGCRHCCRSPMKTPTPFYPPPPGGPISTIPPVAVPTTPGSGGTFPPPVPSAAGSIPPPDPLFGGPPSTGSNFRPSPTPNDGRPAPEILLPDPIPPSGGASRSLYPAPAAPRGVLGDPAAPLRQTAEPPLAPRPTSPPAEAPPRDFPPPAEPSAPAAANPFAPPKPAPAVAAVTPVVDGVASGRVPSAEGFDALRKAGYRTVVFLHPAGADTTAVRVDADQRGMNSIAIETTPERLGAAFEAFKRAVTTAGNRPVYVCDADGVRAGALWFVYFRTVESLNADAARVRARGLGYADDTDEAKTFQVAVQQYLATR